MVDGVDVGVSSCLQCIVYQEGIRPIKNQDEVIPEGFVGGGGVGGGVTQWQRYNNNNGLLSIAAQCWIIHETLKH